MDVTAGFHLNRARFKVGASVDSMANPDSNVQFGVETVIVGDGRDIFVQFLLKAPNLDHMLLRPYPYDL